MRWLTQSRPPHTWLPSCLYIESPSPMASDYIGPKPDSLIYIALFHQVLQRTFSTNARYLSVTSSCSYILNCLKLSAIPRTITLLVIPCLLVSPRHQQRLFWICMAMPSTNNYFNSLCLFSVTKRYKMQISFNTLRPRRNEQHFAEDIFKRIFVNENVLISIKI